MIDAAFNTGFRIENSLKPQKKHARMLFGRGHPGFRIFGGSEILDVGISGGHGIFTRRTFETDLAHPFDGAIASFAIETKEERG